MTTEELSTLMNLPIIGSSGMFVMDGRGKKIHKKSEVIHIKNNGSGIVKKINMDGTVNVRWTFSDTLTTINPHDLYVFSQN